jgi:hypothetical protein
MMIKNDRDVAWDIIAKNLGFKDEKDMLVSLYEGASIPEMAEVLRSSTGTILKRLIRYDIPRRKRGGVQSKASTRYKMFHVDQRIIMVLGLTECSASIGVSTSSLYKYKQWKTGRLLELAGTQKETKDILNEGD